MNGQVEFKGAEPSDGGPAFPTLPEHGFNTGEPGMTLRDHFAAQALPVVANVSWRDLGFKPVDGLSVMENNALCAYQQADAMLKARSA